MKRLLLVVAFTLLAAPAFAQTQVIVNPSWVKFQVSEDHALVDKYELAYFADATTTTPIAGAPVLDLGKPVPDAQGWSPEIAFNVHPVKFSKNLAVRVRAIGTVDGVTYTSPWSPASNPFDRSPGAAGGVVIR